MKRLFFLLLCVVMVSCSSQQKYPKKHNKYKKKGCSCPAWSMTPKVQDYYESRI